MTVTKEDLSVVLYDTEKVVESILKANHSTGEEHLSENDASILAHEVFQKVTSDKSTITTQDIRRCVFMVLKNNRLPDTANAYFYYHKQT